jgi:hypothetical protein
MNSLVTRRPVILVPQSQESMSVYMFFSVNVLSGRGPSPYALTLESDSGSSR